MAASSGHRPTWLAILKNYWRYIVIVLVPILLLPVLENIGGAVSGIYWICFFFVYSNVSLPLKESIQQKWHSLFILLSLLKRKQSEEMSIVCLISILWFFNELNFLNYILRYFRKGWYMKMQCWYMGSILLVWIMKKKTIQFILM